MNKNSLYGTTLYFLRFCRQTHQKDKKFISSNGALFFVKYHKICTIKIPFANASLLKKLNVKYSNCLEVFPENLSSEKCI